MTKRKMGKKKIMDLLAYTTLLLHNNKIDGVLTDIQIDKMMKYATDEFKNDEGKAIGYIQNKVKVLIKDLENELE